MKHSLYCVDRVNGLDVKVLFHDVFLILKRVNQTDSIGLM